MFREALLESSPAARKGKRRHMALAFALEFAVAAVLILIPLFSTGIIPISARVPQPPLRVVRVAEQAPEKPTGGSATGGARAAATRVVEVAATGDRISFPIQPTGEDLPIDPSYRIGNCTTNCLPNGPPIGTGNDSRPQQGPTKPARISVVSEAQLLNRVEPVYPGAAIMVQGVVKLHALIAKDGTVYSLNVISGHPLLATAALDAVRQWRYRPYILNGEPVEVETFITVTFKRNGQ